MELNLVGKRVLITGANSGLGAAIASAFSEEHARVAINYLADPESAQRLATQLRARAPEVLTLQADVGNAAAVDLMFSEMDKAWGGLDILINNAGIDGARALTWEADSEAWNRVLQVNLGGAFHCARAALKRLIPQGSGVIINTSSVHEQIAWAGYGAYVASKAGLSMLSKRWPRKPGHMESVCSVSRQVRFAPPSMRASGRTRPAAVIC